MKKGFTLIELLAVIVILAIIALIATPIVLSIIDETKESAVLRSAEHYLSTVENSIAKKSLSIGGSFSPNICVVQNNGDLLCDGTETLELEISGEVPSTGTITFDKGKVVDVDLTLSNKNIIKNSNGELAYYVSPCTRVTGDKDTPGSLYECEVKPGVKYNFYVLSKESNGTTNLIMDRNINSDGTPATKGITESDKEENGGIYNLVAWINEDDYGTLYPYDKKRCYNTDGCVLDDKGPITAMNFLYNATKDWTNIPALNYTYNDKEYQGTTTKNKSYTSFVSNNGVATITSLAGNKTTIGTSDKPLRARMPIYASKDSIEYGDISKLKTDESNKYLYYHMAVDCFDNEDDHNTAACEDAGYIEGVYEKGIENIDGIYGYWTLSTYANFFNSVWYVRYDGSVNHFIVNNDSLFGVRPAITLKI